MKRNQRVILRSLSSVSLLLFVLSMGDNVTEVLVIQVSSNIQGEICEHLVHLKEEKWDSVLLETGKQLTLFYKSFFKNPSKTLIKQIKHML